MGIKYYHFLIALFLLCDSCSCDSCKNPYLDTYKNHNTTKTASKTKELDGQESSTQADEATRDLMETESETSKPNMPELPTSDEAARDVTEEELEKSKTSAPENKLSSNITEEMIKRARAGNGATHLDWDWFADRLKDFKNGKKVNINKMNLSNSSYTPLHYATDLRDIEITKALLDMGADKESKNSNGHTPLHLTSYGYHGNKEVANLLIASGADLNAEGKNKTTPLHLAAATNNTEMAELFIKAGAMVNVKNSNGQTPLELAQYINATSKNRNEIIKFLSSITTS